MRCYNECSWPDYRRGSYYELLGEVYWECLVPSAIRWNVGTAVSHCRTEESFAAFHSDVSLDAAGSILSDLEGVSP